MNKYNLDKMQEKALQQFKQGKSLFGKDGAFSPLLKDFLEKALESEMEAHLNEEQRAAGNKRNGRGGKTIKSGLGTFNITTPEDRHSTFDPQIVRKRETILADTLAEKIIGLYALGVGYRDIAKQLKEMYDTEISLTTLTQITDRIIPSLKAWQGRQLDAVYPIVFLDAMHQKIKDGHEVKTKALYNVLGINKEGKKEILGLYLSESEGANWWLQVLTDLQNRGIKDILIACTDNLKGFSEAITSVFPQTEIQTCIIHQVRNSFRYVAHKDKKEFMADLKKVYKASSKEIAEEALAELAQKWEKKYALVIRSWQNNWEKLSPYFAYTAPIRKMIYTTNAIEGYHQQLRRVTKNKGAFTNDMAFLKLVYLATKNIEKKWNQPLPNWGLTVQQLAIKFGPRMSAHLTLHPKN